MKRIALIGIAILLVSSATAQEKTTANKWSTFLQQSQMPDGTKYMSAPPQPAQQWHVCMPMRLSLVKWPRRKKDWKKHFDKSHTEKKQSKKLSNNNIET